MPGRRLRTIFVLALFGAAAARLFGWLRPPHVPDVSRHPTVDGGPRPPTPTADPYQGPVVEPSAVVPGLAPLAPLEDHPVIDEVPDDGERPAPTLFDTDTDTDTQGPGPAPTEAATGDEPQTTGAQTWSAPVDGACPSGFPVKAKLRSGIFHVPGGLAYERTHPDRCYPTTEAAEADGLRAAKR